MPWGSQVRPVAEVATAVDVDEAALFIELLTGSDETPVTFQTFGESAEAKTNGGRLIKILHGSIGTHGATLTKLNEQDAGIFLVINETDLKGRKLENVIKVRAVFLDFDDASTNPLQIIAELQPRPHVVVESSSGKAHAYWLTADCTLGQFSSIQARLAATYGGDLKVKDLPRVMRVPGFLHRKGEPFRTRIVSTHDAAPYALAEIVEGLLGVESIIALMKPDSTTDARKTRVARQKAVSGTFVMGTPFDAVEAQNGAPEGSRDDTIFRLACRYRGKGFGYQEAKILVLAAAASCTPPFPEAEALTKLDQAWKFPEAETLTELGNAKRMTTKYGGEIRWVVEFKKWLIWDGTRWTLDDFNVVMNFAKATALAIRSESAGMNDPKKVEAIEKHASKSQNLRTLNATIELARTEAKTSISQSALDSNAMVLGVSNGVVDLTNGQLRSACQEDYITRQAQVCFVQDAASPEWDRFLLTIMGGSKELVDFLQRAVGYSLTGKTSEQCLFFLFGTGRNGKSTFLSVIKEMLGDYGSQCSAETLMVKSREGGANNDIARLRGSRFVSTIEAEEGKRLGESLVKQLTGGDPIVARFLFQENFEFLPQFKIWLAANHKPIVRGDDFAIWRRINLIPFTVTIPDNAVDKSLLEKLAAERSGILNWAIEGCLDWQRSGLRPPEQVREATKDYKAEMDVFGAWLEDCCKVDPFLNNPAFLLYENYRHWCAVGGIFPLGSVKFYLKLVERGFRRERTPQSTLYMGLKLRAV